MNKLVSVLIVGILITSCVPAKRFREVSDKSVKLEGERDHLMAENERLTVANTEMESMIEKVEQQKQSIVQDSIRLHSEYEKLQSEHATLTRKYNDLQASYDALLQGNARETRRLLSQLQSTQEDLQEKEQRLRDLETSVNDKRRDLTQLRAELEARNARLMELQQVLDRKDSAVNALKNKVSNALLGFEGQGLTVQMKNGKVYVSLDEKLLFRSGSYQVDPKGKQALMKLGTVLERNPDVNIMIEGHTDNVPYRGGGALKDNWDLSVMRATSVLKILLDNSRIEPSRLTAAGRGEYQPVDPANTTGARSRNRRTEIILTPKLDELLRILESN